MDGREDKNCDDTTQPSSSQQKRKMDKGDQTLQVKKKAHQSPMEGVRGHFYFIKENVGSDWKDLAFQLGFVRADIDNIASRNRDDKSCCMDLLEEWFKRVGEKATIEALTEALSKADLQSTSDGLKEHAEAAVQSQQVRENQLQTATIKPPGGLKVIKTENERITLQWDPVESDQLFGYCVEKSTVLSNPEFPLKWESTHESLPVLPAQPTELEVGGLKPYTAYNFHVKSAINIEGNLLFGKASTPQYVVTRKQYQPFQPRYVMGRYGDTHDSVSLNWTKPYGAPDIDQNSYGYVVEMCFHPGGSNSHMCTWMELFGTSQQTCTVKVEHNGTYHFRVSAINKDEIVSSLPQEMGNAMIRIHIKTQSGWFESSQLLSSLRARWPFLGSNATDKHAGSIVFVISCLDLDGLRELWMSYNLGKVKKFFQYLFAIAPMPNNFELKITINPQDFYACRQHLLLTCPVDGGRRVVRLGDALARADMQRGLSEDYPVYCKPIWHKTTCAQLDFLDLAISRQPRAVEKVIMQPKQSSAGDKLVRPAGVKPVPDLPVHLHLSLEQQPTASGQTLDVTVSEDILELERTLFTADLSRSPGHYDKIRELFLPHKAILKDAISHGPAILLLTFLRLIDVDRFYHNHYRVGEGTLSQQLSHILISRDLQDKVRGTQLTVGLQVKHEDYVRVRDRLRQGLDCTMSVNNLMALAPPTRHVGSSNLRGLDLAMVSREDQFCQALTDDASTLNFTVQQVQTALQARKVKLQEQLQRLYRTARENSEALVRSLSKEITVLTQKDEKSQKILLEHKEEIMQLQGTNKTKEAQMEELTSENTKLSNQLPNLNDEVRSLREKDKTSQKVLLEKNLEIQRLQDTNKDMATKIQDLLSVKHTLEGKREGESSGKEKDPRKSRIEQSTPEDSGASLEASMDNTAVLLVHDVYGASEREISIKRQVVETLREHVPDIPVFSTVLTATEEDKQNALQDGVELVLPQLHPDDPRTHPSLDWLTFDHRVKYPHLPLKVKSIVGYSDITSRAAVRIKLERYPDTKVILFTVHIPEDIEYYKGDEIAMGIGKKEDSILEDVQEADVVFSLGSKTFDHFSNQFRAIPPQNMPQHFKFVPRPSKVFEDAHAEYKDTETMVVLSIGRVTGVEKLKGYGRAVGALSIVAEKMKIKYRVIGVDKDDIQTRKSILEHCKSANIKITLLPHCTQKKICAEMVQANLVLMPSRAEPFGLIGLEAIAAGVPVLVSSRSGLADFIHEHVDELHHSIVDMDESEEGVTVNLLASSIERVLRHNRAEFKTAARCKQQLLSSKYWEESHQHFIKACTGEAVMRHLQDPAMAGPSKPEHTQIMTRSTAHMGKKDDGSKALKRKAGPPILPVVVEILAQVGQSVQTAEDMVNFATAKHDLCTMDITDDETREMLHRVKHGVKSIPDLLNIVKAVETLEKPTGVKILRVED